MANPDPEITPAQVHAARDDALMATGRSDYPNQVNNVLGFPYIFKAPSTPAPKAITQAMMIAATKALAALAREPVPQEVLDAYQLDKLEFGRDYIIPKPSTAPDRAHPAGRWAAAGRLTTGWRSSRQRRHGVLMKGRRWPLQRMSRCGPGA